MAPKSTVSRSKQPTKPLKEKEVVTEHEISFSSEEEDPEEDEGLDDSPKTTEPKSNPVPLNGFVSDSGSDYDSDDSNSVYRVQPVAKPLVNSPAKRPSGSSNGNTAKKPKTTPSSKKSSNSGTGINVCRIWSKDDEIIMLREMYDFKKSKGGVDLNLDTIAFYDSVKGKLQGEYSKDQLRSKIRHMRSKYLGIVKKCEKGGDPGFANSHEALLFDLSKKAWGDVFRGKKSGDNVVVETVANENGVGGKKDCANVVVEMVANENGVGGKKDRANVVAEVENVVMVEEKGEKEQEEVEERPMLLHYYRFLRESIDVSMKCQQALGLSDAAIKIMRENLHVIGKANASELDDEWKELLMEEMELSHKEVVLNHKRASLVKKQIDLVFDRIKKP